MKLSIDARFDAWAKENPGVVDLYLKFARQVRDAGRKRYSVKALTERIRWEVNIVIRKDGEFRINNNYSAPMARLLVVIDPTLAEIFEFRKRRSLQ
jgi:hypothetical protein